MVAQAAQNEPLAGKIAFRQRDAAPAASLCVLTACVYCRKNRYSNPSSHRLLMGAVCGSKCMRGVFPWHEMLNFSYLRGVLKSLLPVCTNPNLRSGSLGPSQTSDLAHQRIKASRATAEYVATTWMFSRYPLHTSPNIRSAITNQY